VSNTKGSRVGEDLVEAFNEMAAYLRGEADVESYAVEDDSLTPRRIKSIRQKVASSTREFERHFHVPARTMEAYEQGRRRPNAAMAAFLRVIEREPDAVRRALASTRHAA
jgi:putative transcriptional regulator